MSANERRNSGVPADSSPPATAQEESLDQVRLDLRRLGYLTAGLERFFLQDAMRHRPPFASLLRLAGREALLGAPVVASLAALAAGAINGTLETAPLDLVALWLHLLLPAALATAAFFLVAVFALWLLVRSAPRRLERATLGVATVFVALLAFSTTYLARSALADASWGVRAGFLGLAVLAAWVLVRALSSGLLTWAIRVTDRAPDHRLFTRRTAGAALALVALFALGPLFALPSAPRNASEILLPENPGRSLLLVGIDGVLAEEFDYFARRGELEQVRRWLEGGAVLRRYRRDREAPASFWTTIATGLDAERHGVVSLDGFRPLGAARPLLRMGPLRFWFERVAEPLGLAEHRAVLADRREAWSIWELAARGGAPVGAINWWSTYPAERLAGLVMAHGAYQLLAENAAGAVAPAEDAARWELDRRSLPPSPLQSALAAALGEEPAQRELERSLVPDQFYRAAAERETAQHPRTLFVYQPGLDILGARWPAGDVAFGDAARLELREIDGWLARIAPRFDAVALVVDPGRRGGEEREGRVLWWRLGDCAADVGADAVAGLVTPREVASAALRWLGLPQSRELPPPPGGCRWAEPAAVVESYGPRRRQTPAAPDDDYLRNLRSLGYL